MSKSIVFDILVFVNWVYTIFNKYQTKRKFNKSVQFSKLLM